MLSQMRWALLALIWSAGTLAATDSFGPFADFRQVDRKGEFYIVVKRDATDSKGGTSIPVTFEFARRGADRSPVTSVRASGAANLQTLLPDQEVVVRPGDVVLGRGKLDVVVPRILLSSQGLGFVVIDIVPQRPNGSATVPALTTVSEDGKTRRTKNLADLFGECDIGSFFGTGLGIWWCASAWIDDESSELVVVASKYPSIVEPVIRPFRTINLKSGQVKDGTAETVLRALSSTHDESALNVAIEVTIERAFPETRTALIRILNSADRTTRTRLRAAIALAKLGDRRGKDLVVNTAFSDAPESYFAISGLPYAFGDKAAAALCEHVERYSDRDCEPARRAMFLIDSTAAVPALTALLERSPDRRSVDFALKSLGDKGREASTALSQIIAMLDPRGARQVALATKKLAARALGRMGADAEPALSDLIRLAKQFSPEELHRASRKVRENAQDRQAIPGFSRSEFVSAICEIWEAVQRKERGSAKQKAP